MDAHYKYYGFIATTIFFLYLVFASIYEPLHWKTAPYTLAGVAVAVASTGFCFGWFLADAVPTVPSVFFQTFSISVDAPPSTLNVTGPIVTAQALYPTQPNGLCREVELETPGTCRSTDICGPCAVNSKPAIWFAHPNKLRHEVKTETRIHPGERKSAGTGVTEQVDQGNEPCCEVKPETRMHHGVKSEACRLTRAELVELSQTSQFTLAEDIYHTVKSETQRRRERRMRKAMLSERNATMKHLSGAPPPSKVHRTVKLSAHKRADGHKEMHRREARALKRLIHMHEGAEDW